VISNSSIGVQCGFQHIVLVTYEDGLWRFLGGPFLCFLDYGSYLGIHLFLAQVLLDAQMNRQTHDRDCHGS